MPTHLRTPYLAAPGIHALPSHLPLGALGLLPVHAYLIASHQPILVDTGLAIDRAGFADALASLVDPLDLRWIVITHDDRDHCGNLKEALMASPQATVVTSPLTLARLGEEWDVPRHRVRTVNPGRTLELGGRTLRFLRPPSFDSPATLAVYDPAARALFSADAFGTVLPAPADDAADVDPAAYLEGMAAFTRANAPWTALVDQARWDRALAELAALDPRVVLSSHAPAASARIAELLETVRRVPAMGPWLPDDDLEVEAVLARQEASGQ